MWLLDRIPLAGWHSFFGAAIKDASALMHNNDERITFIALIDNP